MNGLRDPNKSRPSMDLPISPALPSHRYRTLSWFPVVGSDSPILWIELLSLGSEDQVGLRKTTYRRLAAVVVAFVTLLGAIWIHEQFLVRRQGEFRVAADPNSPLGQTTRFVRLRENRPLYREVLKLPRPVKTNPGNQGYTEVELSIDENGYVAPSILHENPSLTLAFIGGSTTENRLVQPEKRFPFRVGRILEEKTALRINSLNAGKSGNHSLHSLDILLNKLLADPPEIVFMMHNINDYAVLLNEGTYWPHSGNRSVLVDLGESSWEGTEQLKYGLVEVVDAVGMGTFPHTYRALLQRSVDGLGWRGGFLERKTLRRGEARWEPGDRNTPIDEIVRRFDRNLRSFVVLSKAHDIAPVLMTQPNRVEGGSSGRVGARLEALGSTRKHLAESLYLLNQRIRTVAHEEGTLLIDLAKSIPAAPDHFYDEFHLTNLGSEQVSRQIAEEILQSGLVARTPG